MPPEHRTMKKCHAEEDHAAIVREILASYEGLDHLRVRRRADLVVIESGSEMLIKNFAWTLARIA